MATVAPEPATSVPSTSTPATANTQPSPSSTVGTGFPPYQMGIQPQPIPHVPAALDEKSRRFLKRILITSIIISIANPAVCFLMSYLMFKNIPVESNERDRRKQEESQFMLCYGLPVVKVMLGLVIVIVDIWLLRKPDKMGPFVCWMRVHQIVIFFVCTSTLYTLAMGTIYTVKFPNVVGYGIVLIINELITVILKCYIGCCAGCQFLDKGRLNQRVMPGAGAFGFPPPVGGGGYPAMQMQTPSSPPPLQTQTEDPGTKTVV